MADFTADVAQLQNIQIELKHLSNQTERISASVNSIGQSLGGIKSLANKGYPAKIATLQSAISKAANGTSTAASRIGKIADSYKSCEADVKRAVSNQRATFAEFGARIIQAQERLNWSTAKWHEGTDYAPSLRAAGSVALASMLLNSSDTPSEMASDLEAILTEDKRKVSSVANRTSKKDKLTWKQKLSRFLNDPKTLNVLDSVNNGLDSFLNGPVKNVSNFIGNIKLGGIQLPDIYELSKESEIRERSYLKKIDEMNKAGASKGEMYLYAVSAVASEAYQIAEDTHLVDIVKEYESL